MKKTVLVCAVLCMALLCLCGSALAADAEIQVTPVSANVQVTQDTKNGDPVFTVTKATGVESGQLYLVMIQEGTDAAEKPKPTKENLCYINVEPATASSITLEAYPKELTAGSTYIVYLSDYAENGAAKGVATITVSAGSGGGGDAKIVYGDVNGDGKVKSWDATVLACYLAGQKEFQDINEQNADCDGNGKVRSWDLTILYCYLAGQKEFSQLPDNPHTGS